MARTQGFRLLSPGMSDLLNDPAVRGMLTTLAGPVLARAQAGAPVDTGEYRASLRIIQATTDRAVVRVGSDDDKALVIEARTGNLARSIGAR